jgi:hypothetical protein
MGQGCGSGRAGAGEWKGPTRGFEARESPTITCPESDNRCYWNVVSLLSAFDWRKGGKARANEWRTEIATRASARRDY